MHLPLFLIILTDGEKYRNQVNQVLIFVNA